MLGLLSARAVSQDHPREDTNRHHCRAYRTYKERTLANRYSDLSHQYDKLVNDTNAQLAAVHDSRAGIYPCSLYANRATLLDSSMLTPSPQDSNKKTRLSGASVPNSQISKQTHTSGTYSSASSMRS